MGSSSPSPHTRWSSSTTWSSPSSILLLGHSIIHHDYDIPTSEGSNAIGLQQDPRDDGVIAGSTITARGHLGHSPSANHSAEEEEAEREDPPAVQEKGSTSHGSGGGAPRVGALESAFKCWGYQVSGFGVYSVMEHDSSTMANSSMLVYSYSTRND